MPAMVTPEAFRALPKVELHLHAAGSVRPETMRELVAADGLPAALADEYRPAERGEGLTRALARFAAWDATVRTPERLARVTAELCEDLAADGVVYAEVRLRPPAGQDDGLWNALIEAAVDAARAVGGPAISFTTVLLRGWSAEDAEREARRSARRVARGVSGIDVAGDETVFGLEPLVGAMRLAREACLGISTHAGEVYARSVRVALDQIAPARIAHGFLAAEDPALVAELRERGAHLEIAPNSNVLIGSAPNLEDHPFPRLLRDGLSVGLNTDNHTICGTTLSEEYARAADAFDLSHAELTQATLHAAEATFLPPPAKRDLVRRIRDGWGDAPD
jgi:adenosine deaminase